MLAPAGRYFILGRIGAGRGTTQTRKPNMRTTWASAWATVLLAGCGSQPPPEPEPAPLPVRPAAAPATADPVEWTGSIWDRGGSAFEGSVVAHVYPTRSIVMVRVRGVGEQDMPWHVHEGETPGGAVVGPESGYPLLRRGPEPTVQSHSELFGLRLQDGRQYKVDVHASLARTAPVVGCANLARRP